MYGKIGGDRLKRKMYAHMYEATLTQSIAIWEGLITSLMFAQVLKPNVPPCNVAGVLVMAHIPI